MKLSRIKFAALIIATISAQAHATLVNVDLNVPPSLAQCCIRIHIALTDASGNVHHSDIDSAKAGALIRVPFETVANNERRSVKVTLTAQCGASMVNGKCMDGTHEALRTVNFPAGLFNLYVPIEASGWTNTSEEVDPSFCTGAPVPCSTPTTGWKPKPLNWFEKLDRYMHGDTESFNRKDD